MLFISNNFQKSIDTEKNICYNVGNLIVKTVDAEITAIMSIQRTCGAENQVRNKLSNGPLRVQSNVIYHKVFCNVLAYVNCRGYVCILLSA